MLCVLYNASFTYQKIWWIFDVFHFCFPLHRLVPISLEKENHIAAATVSLLPPATFNYPSYISPISTYIYIQTLYRMCMWKQCFAIITIIRSAHGFMKSDWKLPEWFKLWWAKKNYMKIVKWYNQNQKGLWLLLLFFFCWDLQSVHGRCIFLPHIFYVIDLIIGTFGKRIPNGDTKTPCSRIKALNCAQMCNFHRYRKRRWRIKSANLYGKSTLFRVLIHRAMCIVCVMWDIRRTTISILS